MQQKKKKKYMKIETYNILFKKFSKLYNMQMDIKQKSPIKKGEIEIVHEGSKYFDYLYKPFEYSKYLVDYLESVNKEYCKVYRDKIIKWRNGEPGCVDMPPIFTHFQKLILSIDNEEYEKSEVIKNFILKNY